MDRRRVLIAGAVVATAWIVVLLLRSSVAGLATMYPEALPPHPYFLPDQFLTIGVLSPLAVAAMVLVLIAPGALLVLAAGRVHGIADLAIKGFGTSYLLRWLLHAGIILVGLRWSAGLFIGTEIVLCIAAWSALMLRRAQFPEPFQRLAAGVERRRAIVALALPALLVVVLAPMVFWQDITADGLEALTSGLSLNDHVLPRFPNSIGLMGLGIGMAAMAYPTHWFVTLIGPLEAAARLPAALYLPLLYLVLTALIEEKAPRALRRVEELAVVGVLAAFVATLGFNGSYEPYAADLSAPAAFESLTVLAMASAMISLWRGQTGWFVGFTLLTYFARPTGFLFLLLMALGSVALKPADRRAWLRRIGIGMLACIGLYLLYEKVFIGIAGEGRGRYMTESILQRLQYLRFLDLRRLLFVVVPTGVLPALALFALPKQDRLARSLAIFCLLYFVFFFVQAFVALHHFAPLMLLPVAVFWRIVLRERVRRWPAAAALAGAALGVALAIPPGYDVFRAPRPIGRTTAFSAGDILGTYDQYREARDAFGIVSALFPGEVESDDPAVELTLAPDPIVYYAHRYRPEPGTAQYVFQATGSPAPIGTVEVAEADGMSVFVRDTLLWQEVRRSPPSTDFRSALYALPRETLFRYRGIPARNYDLNLATLPFIWRLFNR